MWLDVQVQYPHGKKRTFRLFSDDLGNLMEVLNYLISSGCQLLTAILNDQGGKPTPLSVEVFDGESISNGMQRLHAEYEHVHRSFELKKQD